MRILALSAVLWLALASPGEAAQTGKDLKAICEDQTPNLQGVCVGYILGIADIMTQFSHDGGYFLGFRACMPEISVVQAQGVVVKFLNSHPDRLDRAGFSLIARALAEAYPCQ